MRALALACMLGTASVAMAAPPSPPRVSVPQIPLMPQIRVHASGMLIDSKRSYVDFGVRLFWLHEVGGRFEHLQGRGVLLDGDSQDDAPRIRVEAWVKVAEVRMNSKRLRRELLSPGFFDAEHHPYVHFASVPMPLDALGRGGPIEGTLTVRGITRIVHFQMLPEDCPAPGQAPCTLSVRGRIVRADFGMLEHRAVLSDHVQLIMHIRLRALS